MSKVVLVGLILFGLFAAPNAAVFEDGCEECYIMDIQDPAGPGTFEGSACLDLIDGGWTACVEFTSGGGPAGCFVFFYCPLWAL